MLPGAEITASNGDIIRCTNDA